MDIILWIVVILLAYVCGRITATANPSKQTEHNAADLDSMRIDIAYYKKLTNTLVEENKELKQKNR